MQNTKSIWVICSTSCIVITSTLILDGWTLQRYWMNISKSHQWLLHLNLSCSILCWNITNIKILSRIWGELTQSHQKVLRITILDQILSVLYKIMGETHKNTNLLRPWSATNSSPMIKYYRIKHVRIWKTRLYNGKSIVKMKATTWIDFYSSKAKHFLTPTTKLFVTLEKVWSARCRAGKISTTI